MAAKKVSSKKPKTRVSSKKKSTPNTGNPWLRDKKGTARNLRSQINKEKRQSGFVGEDRYTAEGGKIVGGQVWKYPNTSGGAIGRFFANRQKQGIPSRKELDYLTRLKENQGTDGVSYGKKQEEMSFARRIAAHEVYQSERPSPKNSARKKRVLETESKRMTAQASSFANGRSKKTNLQNNKNKKKK